METTMKIFCVGNSFAVDAATYLHQIAEYAGQSIDVCVLYYGGCSVQRHWENFESRRSEYELYVNGNRYPTMYCNLFEGMNYFKKWDVITFQQRSGDSVDASLFFPELNLLQNGIRSYSDATFVLHQTWAYGKDFSHERYGHDPMDQDSMAKDIRNAYLSVSEIAKIPCIIPVGEAIRLAREKYGDVLTRDGYHLNELGRALAGLVWAYYFLGTNIKVEGFSPAGYSFSDSVPGIGPEKFLELIPIAKAAIELNKGHNFHEKL